LRGPRKILDFGDMDSQKWLAYGGFKPWPLSWGYWIEGTKLMAAEKRLARRFDLCTATTRAERATLKSYGTGVPADWFPNGVDADTISFVGRMDYYPNIECMLDFCEHTLPLLRRQEPSIRLMIVGADPVAKIRRLEEIDGVTVTGSVAEVQPYVRRSAMTVAPLNIARGTQNKILESLAMGVPCVCSDMAAGGVDCVPGEHILTASSPEQYAIEILRLLNEPEERRRFAEAGRLRMESNHTWSGSMRKLDGIIAGCVGK